MEQNDFQAGSFAADVWENDHSCRNVRSPRKRKRTSLKQRSWVTATKVGVGITIIVGVLFLMAFTAKCYLFADCPVNSVILQPPYILPGAAETLMVPYDKLEATTSIRQYSGLVTLEISGTGKAAGSSYSDAFYLYTDEKGSPYQIPLTEAFDLEIDGQRAIAALGVRHNPPYYSTQHRYTVTYDVGIRSRTIQFRISDSYVVDNTGSFQISIYEGARWQPYQK